MLVENTRGELDVFASLLTGTATAIQTGLVLEGSPGPRLRFYCRL